MQNNQINYSQITQGLNFMKSEIKTLQSYKMKHINELNPALVARGNELLKQIENIESNITIKNHQEILQIFAESLKLKSDHQKQVSLYDKEMEDVSKIIGEVFLLMKTKKKMLNRICSTCKKLNDF